MTSINFWYRQQLNLRSLIQPSEILLRFHFFPHTNEKNGDVSGGNGFPNDHKRFFNNLARLAFFFFFL